MTTLTVADFEKLIDDLLPILYYAITGWIEPGAIYHVQAIGSYPEYIVVHPDDFEKAKAMFTWRRLVSIKEYKFTGGNYESPYKITGY